MHAGRFPDYPSFGEWLGIVPCGGARGQHDGLPSAETISARFESAYYSKLGAGGGRSINEALTQEMQSIGCDSCLSSDHTYDTGRNFLAEKGGEKPTRQWNAARGKDIAILSTVMTRGESRAELLHAKEKLAHRPNFDPKYWWTDTWPGDRCDFRSIWWWVLMGGVYAGCASSMRKQVDKNT